MADRTPEQEAAFRAALHKLIYADVDAPKVDPMQPVWDKVQAGEEVRRNWLNQNVPYPGGAIANTAADFFTVDSSEGLLGSLPMPGMGLLKRGGAGSKVMDTELARGEKSMHWSTKSGRPENCAGGTCGGAGRRLGECGHAGSPGCYDLTGRGAMGNVAESRLGQMEEFDQLGPQKWVEQHSAQIKKEKPKNLRLFTAGDARDQSVVDAVTELARQNPQTIVYAPTKRADLNWDEFRKLPNARVVFSEGGEFQARIPEGAARTYVLPEGAEPRPGSVDWGDTDSAVIDRGNEPGITFYTRAHARGGKQFGKESPPMVGGNRAGDPPADAGNIPLPRIRFPMKRNPQR